MASATKATRSTLEDAILVPHMAPPKHRPKNQKRSLNKGKRGLPKVGFCKEEATIPTADDGSSEQREGDSNVKVNKMIFGLDLLEIEEATSSLIPAFTCRICKDGVKMNVIEFRAHYQNQHQGVKLPRVAKYLHMYTCNICGGYYKGWYKFRRHMDIHDNIYDCETCGAFYKKVLDYILHMRVHATKNLLECIYCDYTTTSKNDITNHLKTTHQTIEHKYVCGICEKGFELYTWFKEHDNFHSGQRPYKCELCEESFLYTRHLSAHKLCVHKQNAPPRVPSVYECAICGREFKNRRSLKLHMHKHNGKEVTCEVCGKQLSSMEVLKFHMRVHTGYKPFKCRHCGKAFTRKTMVKEHERVHTGVKPFVCPQCKKSFTQRTSLVIHIRGHTGERPYACHICGKTFVAKTLFNAHFKKCRGY